MKIAFDANGWNDYTSWVRDPTILTRINRMIQEAARDPLGGIGKPERLRGDLSGYYSRRINQEHRLVYTVRDGALIVIQCRSHY